MAVMSTDIVVCPNCGAKNRVSADQRAKHAVCGRCKTELPDVSTKPIDVSDATFAEIVERSPVPVLVDLWAPWCGPCRMLAPTIEQLARDLAGKVRVVKLNTDDNQRTAGRFNITGIPTLLLFSAGREVDRIVGMAQAEEIKRRLSAIAPI